MSSNRPGGKVFFRPLLPLRFHDHCVYCGYPAHTRDHFRPWATSRCRYWVPSCDTCNSLLGPSIQETFGERLGYLAWRYLRKYRRYDGYDYARLCRQTSGNLQARFFQEKAAQTVLHQKLAWINFLTPLTFNLSLEGLCEDEKAVELLCELLDVIENREFRAKRNKSL